MVLKILLIPLLSLASIAQAQLSPKGSCDQVVKHTYYSLCYSYNHRQAEWVFHKLTVQSVNGKQKRTNDFRADHLVEDPVGKKDFSGSGYDRGHMVPAADMKLSKVSMSETFFMTNMSPQAPGMNRGIWATLENKIRDWVRKDGDAYVVTAPILEKGLSRIKSGVSIPDYYYKLIYFPKTQVMKAFLMPNKKGGSKNIYDYSVSVDEIEEYTGLDFFSDLPDKLEEELESTSYYLN